MATLIRGESIRISNPEGREEVTKTEIVSSLRPPDNSRAHICIAKFVVPAEGLETHSSLSKNVWETIWAGNPKYRGSIPQVLQLLYELLFLEALIFATGKFLPVFSEIAPKLARNATDPTTLGLIEDATKYLGVYEIAEIFLEAPVQPRTQDMVKAVFTPTERKLGKDEHKLAQELASYLTDNAVSLPLPLNPEPYKVISRAMTLGVQKLGNRVLLCSPLLPGLTNPEEGDDVEKLAEWAFRLEEPTLVGESKLPLANYRGLLENLLLFKDFLNFSEV